jgi:hypothetical protein
MLNLLVRYRVRPEKVAENEKLIRDVFRELQAKAPDDVRYLVLSLSDGTFCHLVEDRSKKIPALDAFAAFRRGGAIRNSYRQPSSATIGCLRARDPSMNGTCR